MAETIVNYSLSTLVGLPAMPTVDGVEIITRREREALAAMFERQRRAIDQQIEDAFYGITRLPSP